MRLLLAQSQECGFMANKAICKALLEMLVVLGKLDAANIGPLLECSERTGLPVGRVLVMCRRLSEEELTTCLEAAQSVASGSKTFTRAVILLKLTLAAGQIDSAQKLPRQTENLSGLCLLMLAGGAVSMTELNNHTAHRCINGRILHEHKILTVNQWQDGIELLRKLKWKSSCLTDFIAEEGSNNSLIARETLDARRQAREERRKELRLGELLLGAGLIDRITMLEMLEYAVEHEVLLGQTLVKREILSPRLLQAGLVLQKFIETRTLSKEQAISVLEELADSDETIGQITRRFVTFKQELMHLLLVADLVNQAEAARACANLLSPPLSFFNLLIEQDISNAQILKSAIKCLMLVKQGYLTETAAIETLKHLRHSQANLPAPYPSSKAPNPEPIYAA